MANLNEVLVTCDSNNTLWTTSIWDPQTGTSLMTYKGGGTAESRTLSFIGQDYLSTVERTKPILHVWPLNSHQTVQGKRFILPGKASAFAISSDGAFCVAAIDEKIYLWQMASGNLLTILNRHYQRVILLKFTSDGRFFVSAAEDGMVMVWCLATVSAHPEVELVTQSTAGQHDPLYIFSDHSLPVTDMYISKFGILGRLCTVSSDRTCKIYDLSSGDMLLNLVFDVPLSAVTFDVLELNIFIGTLEGDIHECSLTNPPRTRDLLVNVDTNPTFKSHQKAVTCISASIDGETLMSASNDEQVILWHIRSKQPVRTIRHKGPVTNAEFIINFPAIYKQEFKPSIILHSLDRSLEKDTDEVTEIEVLTKNSIDFWPSNVCNQPSSTNYDSSVSNKEMENEFKRKEAVLQGEIEQLKRVNASLYALSVEKALNGVHTNGNTNVKKNVNKNKNKKNKNKF